MVLVQEALCGDLLRFMYRKYGGRLPERVAVSLVLRPLLRAIAKSGTPEIFTAAALLLVVAVVLRALHDVGLWAEFLFLLRAVVWSGWLACRRLCRQGLGTWLGSC